MALQPAIVTLCCAIVVQYWLLVALVRRFTARFGRAPRLSSYSPVRGMTAEERILSLAVFGLGIVPALVVVKLVYLN